MENTTTQYPIYKLGDIVELVAFSLGQGSLQLGDTGIVAYVGEQNKGISTDYYELDIGGNNGYFMVCASDIKLSTQKANYTSTDIRNMTDKYMQLLQKKYDTMATAIYKEDNNKQKHYQAYLESIRKINMLNDVLAMKNKFMNDEYNMRSTNVYNAFRSLYNLYDSIIITKDKITAITKVIEFDYKCPRNKEKYHITFQPFKITINIMDEISIMPLDSNKTIHFRGYFHPHIVQSGQPCFGTYTEQIIQYSDNWQFIHLLQMIHKYLSSIDYNGWYTPVWGWADNAKELCMECGKIDCVCEDEIRCEYCDRPEDDCDCTRCPSSGERMPDGIPDDYCYDCRHWCTDNDGYCAF